VKLGRWTYAVPAVALLAALLGALSLRPTTELGPGTLQTSTLTPTRIPGPCERGATKPFTPKTIDIENVRKGLPIVGLARDGSDVPGVPPVNATHTVAWDAPGPKPGSESGLVRFNAHTWPNNGALGNEMLAHFQIGDILTVHDGDTKLCYEVTERVEVGANSGYKPFFENLNVPSRFAFIVCSGKRLGPGDWSMRTIWFGTPYYGDPPDA
jgi:hypothetical protein